MDNSSHEELLLGGNSAASVVRVGTTVRREAQRSTESVNALLTHFERLGVAGVPRFLGYDERGRQMLTYAAGSANPDPSDLGLEHLARVGRLIRSLHDAAESFVEPEDATWNVVITPDESTLICHHDLAPWNLVRGADELTFIDWDGAGPGSRLWDLAYAAHGFVPLSPRAELTLDQAATRLRAFVDGYAPTRDERERLAPLLGPRVRSMYELLRSGAREEREPWAKLVREGHDTMWLEDANFITAHDATWRAALGLAH